MSQFFVNVADSNLPPDVATKFHTDDGNTAIPAANILNVVGGSGISTSNVAPGSNNVIISLQNGKTGTAQTIGLQTVTILTFPLAATPTTYIFEARIAAIDKNTGTAAGFSAFCTIVTNGVTASILTDTDLINHEDTTPVTGISGATTAFAVSANSALLTVIGIAAHTINWSAFGVYVSVDQSF